MCRHPGCYAETTRTELYCARHLAERADRMFLERTLERIAEALETQNRILDNLAGAACFHEFGGYVSPLAPTETPMPVAQTAVPDNLPFADALDEHQAAIDRDVTPF